MRRLFILLFLCCIAGFVLHAETAVERADRLHDEERHRENYEMLKDAVDAASGSSEKAQLLWRLSRSTQEIGDLMEREGASESRLLEKFQEGEAYADQAISLDPECHWAYYYKSANIGRWGETKGILNSLFKAKPMRDLLHQALTINPEHTESFYVLGIMYERVPGWPVSFGDADTSVSLGRKAVDANAADVRAGVTDEVKLTYHMELARHLKKRDWSASKRRKQQRKHERQYRGASDVLEKNSHYEGVVDIPNMSDAEEALQTIRWVVDQYEAKATLSDGETADYEEALADLESWTK